MPQSSVLDDSYELVLGPAAIRTLLGLPGHERKELAASLREELVNGPNAHSEVKFDSDLRALSEDTTDKGPVYTATPLSFAAYIAVHRPLTKEELKRLRRERGSRTAHKGFFVMDILAASTAFTRPVLLA